jgi:type VI secretion system protein ImpJ
MWDQLKTSGGVALQVAGEFPGLTMEFWAIRG